MRTIWKFSIPVDDVVNIVAPKGAQFRRFAAQGRNWLCIWMEVEVQTGALGKGLGVCDDAGMEKLAFCIRGTGHPIPDGFRYLASCDDGPYVWHLFAPTGSMV